MIWSKVIQIVVLIVSVLTITVIYNKWPHIKPDNVIEEKLEEGLKFYTGFEVDLSPFEGEEQYGNNKRIK